MLANLPASYISQRHTLNYQQHVFPLFDGPNISWMAIGLGYDLLQDVVVNLLF